MSLQWLQAYLTWTISLEKPHAEGGITAREFHERQLASATAPGWAKQQAEDALQPPSLEPMEEASLKSGYPVDWAMTMLSIFADLSKQRARGESVQPLRFVDIEAYLRLFDLKLYQLELDTILAMDATFTSEAQMLQQETLNKHK